MSSNMPPIGADPALAGIQGQQQAQQPATAQEAWKTLEQNTPGVVRDVSQQLEYKTGEIINGR
jgi:hypothetical protein